MSKLEPSSVFQSLQNTYGDQKWWPANTPFEVMVGAILTQNTAWSNVEKAIFNLVEANCLSARQILKIKNDTLANLIRPSGYFNVKAARLINYCKWYVDAGEIDQLNELSTEALRLAILSVNGVGEETADDILLYAFERPVFVVDTYTKRLFSRLGLVEANIKYRDLQQVLLKTLPVETKLYNQFHALIVIHCKDVCKKKPRCGECCLQKVCPSFSS